jgi:multidrug efflux pump subunit AcrA (membrane-fusion protein)
VVCTLRARGKVNVASTVKWVVDDGTAVKKGEKLIVLDDSALQEELKLRALDLEQAAAAHAKALEGLKFVRTDNEIDIRLAEITLRLAELRLKRDKGEDRDLKEELQLKVERARLGLKRVKARAHARAAAAQAGVHVQAAQVALERDRKNDVEAELRKCVLRASQDGVVNYYVPEGARGGSGSPRPIVAQGEPVREGQKLFQIPDLSHMQVNVRVHEALVSHLRGVNPDDKGSWQRALIRVDAYPNRLLTGHVKTVDTVASQQDWFASDVKVYKTVVAIDTPMDGLKPGMSADVHILARLTPGPVLQVPLQSVVTVGKKRLCLVVADREIQEREVVTGLSNELAVEIRSGLKEGDRVILSPRVLARRLALWLDLTGKRSAGQGRARGPAGIVVRSVRPAGDSARRAWVETYGLTHTDCERIAALPAVRQAVPVRSFPHEARRLSRVSIANVVATTPEYAEVKGLWPAEGRFLTEADGRHLRNVVVLGATVADQLFGGEEPVGATIVLGQSVYTVVGVLLDENEARGGLAAWDTNRGIFLPLRTCQARFGERIRIIRGATRRAEAVALHAILVTVRAPGDVPAAVEDIREILEQTHTQQDWSAAPGPLGL